MSSDAAKMSGKKGLQVEVATHDNDPDFYSALSFLPNPDVILRKLGKSQEVFDAIAADPHVMGERRSSRSGLLGYEYRLKPGGETPADIRAYDLGLQLLANNPTKNMQWVDTFWCMAQAEYRGYTVHEVVWGRAGDALMPLKVVDRPGRRFVFNTNGELRLKTKEHPQKGEECKPRKWLLTRHMPSASNPYGEALFSSCYWPYVFKHSGLKYFHKFCEKYGIPWVTIEMPQGSTPAQLKEAAKTAAEMIEDAVAVFPQGGQVGLVTPGGGMAKLPQERLISLCNKEISKCLTSQTLSSEMDGQGSRSAAETHRGKEKDVNGTTRDLIRYTMNDLLRWITEVNVANANPPVFEFYEEEEARSEWVDVFDRAREFMPIPLSFAQSRLQIPAPKEGEELLSSAPQAAPRPVNDSVEFSETKHSQQIDDVEAMTQQVVDKADPIIMDMAAPIRDLLASVDDLNEFRDGLLKMYPMMDEERLTKLNSQALQLGMLTGMDQAGG